MSLARLADRLPPHLVRPVVTCLITELNNLIDEREAEEAEMRRLGAGGIEISAHRKATIGIREAVDRWERALGTRDAA